MLEQGIIPCRPECDVGFDLVAIAGDYIWKVQVKSTSDESHKGCKDYLRFGSVRTKGQRYEPGLVDFFACVSLARGDMWIVPYEFAMNRSTIGLPRGGAYYEAWNLFRRGTDAPRTNNN